MMFTWGLPRVPVTGRGQASGGHVDPNPIKKSDAYWCEDCEVRWYCAKDTPEPCWSCGGDGRNLMAMEAGKLGQPRPSDASSGSLLEAADDAREAVDG